VESVSRDIKFKVDDGMKFGALVWEGTVSASKQVSIVEDTASSGTIGSRRGMPEVPCKITAEPRTRWADKRGIWGVSCLPAR
jgi:hypothetical protein